MPRCHVSKHSPRVDGGTRHDARSPQAEAVASCDRFTHRLLIWVTILYAGIQCEFVRDYTLIIRATRLDCESQFVTGLDGEAGAHKLKC